MPMYQGHKNWNHWNVRLWLNNDENRYRAMREFVEDFRGNKDAAARAMFAELKRSGIEKTPDGAPYSISAIRAAMRA